MKEYFEAAIKNVYRHGDTDIFPFPIENRILFDEIGKVVQLLEAAHTNFEDTFSQDAPYDLRDLAPVGLNGFRTATQLDPFWNCYLLGIVLSIAERIEEKRLPESTVFSYRLEKDTYKEGDIFRKDVSWIDFYSASRDISETNAFVLTCDIADCYGRISHHKLENALNMIGTDQQVKRSILRYISYTTGTKSSGLPVGGPAARILAELALNNIDIHLKNSGIAFVRYADDFHIFCASKRDAFSALITLTEALENEGLLLQRSKTRILSKSEFSSQCDLVLGKKEGTPTPVQRLMSLSLRYDPYSANAAANYESLRDELKNIDIISLLNEQLSRSNIHIPTTKKIISALSVIDPAYQFGAIISMIQNMNILHPIASNVFLSISNIFENLDQKHQELVCDSIRDLYDKGHEVMQIAVHVAYANRILAKLKSPENEAFLHRCFEREESAMVRRDIYIIFANWSNYSWLSIRLGRFTAMSAWERRAAILASFYMSDEGSHWRKHTSARFTDLEELVRLWRAAKQNFELPLS